MIDSSIGIGESLDLATKTPNFRFLLLFHVGGIKGIVDPALFHSLLLRTWSCVVCLKSTDSM